MYRPLDVCNVECGGCYRPIKDHPNQECPAYYIPIYHPTTKNLVGYEYHTIRKGNKNAS